MKIAILAWGSLAWDPRELQFTGLWNPEGPELFLEFLRISRDGRLTLVIDEEQGTPVRSGYYLSAFQNLDGAIANLRKREKVQSDDIGYVNFKTGRTRQSALKRHPLAFEAIITWARERELEGVVWTGLPANFKEKQKTEFSPEAAVHYLNGLDAEKRAQAVEYIQRAPAQIQTRFRQMFRTRPEGEIYLFVDG